jgi:HD superfamily phosphodiesterase
MRAMEAGDLPDSAEKRFVYTISIINGKARQMRQQKFMNDFDAAKTAFEAYLDEYDREDDKIHLKIVHTYGVVEDAEAISRRMGLNEEDVQLAKVIGLLHDIGRFEQIKRFDSFEPGTMEHAAYGAQLLFGPEKMIRRFVKDDRFDELICTAIEKHSDFKLEGITDERTLLHAKLIRDADKLDNCRVKLEEAMETLLGVDEKGAGEGVIAPKVWASCMAKESVLSADRVSKVDYWVSYIAQYYDINFPETYEIMREHDYVKRIADRVPYALPETQEKMDILVAEMEKYMDERIRNGK